MRDEVYKKFVNDFSNILAKKTNGKCFSEIICLCIGSDRATGDSFGPLVGDKLNSLFNNDICITIIGSLNKTVNSSNINKIINDIKNTYQNPFIIAIDSAMSNKKEPGEIIVSDDAIKIAAGMNRNIESVGNMSIKGIVSPISNNPKCNLYLLQNTKLSLVMNMADIVSKRNL